MTTGKSTSWSKTAVAKKAAEFALFAKKFQQEFPTEEAAVRELARRLKEAGEGLCPHCRCEFEQESAERLIQCANCHRGWWLTAGTLFNRAREILPWLAAIWFLERGITFVPAQLAELFGKSTSTIAAIKKKIEIVICSDMEEAPQVCSGEFTSLYCRRTSETPSGAHPKEEQTRLEQDCDAGAGSEEALNAVALLDRMSACMVDEKLSESEQSILACIGTRTVLFDTIMAETKLPVGAVNAGLFMLEHQGFIKSPSIDYYSRAGPSKYGTRHHERGLSRKCFDNFLDYIKTHFQGIGRKYVQLYLALYWCISDRQHWGPGVLLDRCARFREVTDYEIRNYVSPQMVKMRD